MRPRCASTGARLELGVSERSGGDPHSAQQLRRQRGHRDDGGSPAEHLGLRPVGGAAGVCRSVGRSVWCTNCVTANTLSGGGRYDLRPTYEGTAVLGCRVTLAQTTGRARGTTRARLAASWMPLPRCRAPTNSHGRRLRKRYGKVRSHLFTFLEHPEVPPDNNGSERELRPTATYRKVTGGFRSTWGADLFAGVRSVLGTAARQGKGCAITRILAVLDGESAIQPG